MHVYIVCTCVDCSLLQFYVFQIIVAMYVCRCEQVLTACVSVRNCLKLYQVSEQQHANQLKSYCLQVISNHWVCVCVCVCMCVRDATIY